MVTVTHKKIDDYYMDINRWIKKGITYDALYICITKWEKHKNSYDDNYSINEIRNIYHPGGKSKAIKELNRW